MRKDREIVLQATANNMNPWIVNKDVINFKEMNLSKQAQPDQQNTTIEQ